MPYQIGKKIKLMDDILGVPIEATIVFIEYDPEMNFNWLYLKGEYEEDNVLYDPKLPEKYFKLIPDNDEFIIPDEE